MSLLFMKFSDSYQIAFLKNLVVLYFLADLHISLQSNYGLHKEVLSRH